MATNRTFTMIKPDATGAGHTGKIIDRIIENGFTIKAMKWTQLTLADAQAFYAVHSERPFFGELTEYMSSGPIVAAILEKDNAMADFRTLIGATNPAEAAPGTIRADFRREHCSQCSAWKRQRRERRHRRQFLLQRARTRLIASTAQAVYSGHDLTDPSGRQYFRAPSVLHQGWTTI